MVEELLVGGLVFISGYTHFTHYWNHADFSWKRLGTVSVTVELLLVCMYQRVPVVGSVCECQPVTQSVSQSIDSIPMEH